MPTMTGWRHETMVAVALSLLVVGACTPGGGGGGGGGDSGGVPWGNYASGVKSRIDALAANGDCEGLQDEFDTADANDDAQRARTGEGNGDLMGYIDGKMRAAGCY